MMMAIPAQFEPWVARLPYLLNGLILFAMAWAIANVIWTVLTPLPAWSTQLSTATVSRQSETVTAPELGQLAVFGSRDTRPQASVQVKSEEVPVTRLNYQLTGIYYSTDTNLALAIIEKVNDDQSVFRVGEELAEGVSLYAIEQDHVLLDRYGKIERLAMSQASPVSSDASKYRNPAQTRVSNSPETAFLKTYKARYINNPMALANRFRAIPVAEGGKNIGFRLRPVRGEVLLQKLGLTENDVFTAINGISLDKPFQALDALKSLRTAKDLSITYRRNGVEQVRDYSLE